MFQRSRLERELREVAGETAASAKLAPIEIVDEREAPLDGERYTLRQGGVIDKGVLANGRFQLQKVDVSKPFSAEVEGRVLVIKEGAVLHTDELGVEYGGTFVDWRLADDPKQADTVFWPQYTELRRTQHEGPSTFWQHEHLIRRRISLRKGWAAAGKRATLQAAPLRIRTGPLVRYTSADEAVIWLELETPCLVRVSYCKMTEQRQAPRPGPRFDSKGCERRHAATVRVGGRSFAMVILDKLAEDTLYRYTIELAPMLAVDPIPKVEAGFKDEWFSRPARRVQDAVAAQLGSASLRGDAWLFVRTLRRRYDRLRFAHGSCRKWPGDTGEDGYAPGEDMLEAFGELWLPEQRLLDDWPRFVLHTGDQIYADDIGVKTGAAIMRQRFGARPPGPKPADDLTAGAWAGRFAHRFLAVAPDKLKPTGKIAPLEAKERKLREKVLADVSKTRAQNKKLSSAQMKSLVELTDLQKHLKQASRQPTPADFINDPKAMRFRHVATNHFLWRVPKYEDGVPNVKVYKIEGKDGSVHPAAGETRGVHAADFAEFSYLYEQAWTTRHCRKVLANLPQFMMFDDHEITDDWNRDRKWVAQLFSPQDEFAYWPHAITDGLIAYWTYQGWGNIAPKEWKQRTLAKILVAARDSGTDALPELRRAVHKQAAKPPGGLIFHYELPIDSPKVLVSDMRTRKRLGATDDDTSSWDKQQLDWLQSRLKNQDRGAAAFVVLSLPYLLPRFVSYLMRHLPAIADVIGKRDEMVRGTLFDMEHPVMTASWEELKKVFLELQNSVTPLKSVVLLSGDVHMAFNLRAGIRAEGYELPPEPVQLVSSSMRNRLNESNEQVTLAALWWFAKNHTLGNMHIQPGGYEGLRGELTSVLFETNIALIDCKVADGKVELAQKYLTRARQAPTLRSRDVIYRRSETDKYLTPVSRS